MIPVPSSLHVMRLTTVTDDQLFLDEVCSLLQDMVFGCPVYFSIKKLKLTDSSVHAKALTVDLTHYLPHFSEKSFRPKANLLP